MPGDYKPSFKGPGVSCHSSCEPDKVTKITCNQTGPEVELDNRLEL